jgi:phage baseplate assembly protein W
MAQGYKGISFPFRIGVKGGVVMTTTSRDNISHIKESMQQIILTRQNERCMEQQIYSSVDTHIFDPNDVSTRSLIAFEVEEAIKKNEPRVEVLSVSTYEEDNIIWATVTFKVLSYDVVQEVDLKVGDVNVQSGE